MKSSKFQVPSSELNGDFPGTPLRVLITGATSGLGREMARQLAKEGVRLALTGRREDKLAEACREVEAAGSEAVALPGDVVDLKSVQASYAAIAKKWGGLDWAILNAGIGGESDFKRLNAEVCRGMIETNIVGVTNWMSAILPDMIRARQGRVGVVASLAGFRGLPTKGVYSATKAALISLCESARIDLRGTGVSIVTICPGFVKSELTAKNDPRSMPFLLETEDGVRRMLDGMRQGRRLVHFPWQLSLPLRYLIVPMPSFLYERLMSRLVGRVVSRSRAG